MIFIRISRVDAVQDFSVPVDGDVVSLDALARNE